MLVVLVILRAPGRILECIVGRDDRVELGTVSCGLIVRMIPARKIAELAIDRLRAGARAQA